jgi:Ca-activated chloride channel family protein
VNALRLRASAVLLFSCACTANLRVQQVTPLRSGVNLVNVSFTARDARSALVDRLTQDDVDVLEDSVPQKIAFFARSSDVPLTLRYGNEAQCQQSVA